MSYHFTIKNTRSLTYAHLLDSKYLSQQVNVSFEVNINDPLDGYSKFYIPDKSSRGVAVTTNEEEYDVEINVGASGTDYFLATRIALAFGYLNSSLIHPEDFDGLAIQEFEQNYDENWAESNKHLGIGAMKYMVEKEGTTFSLPGCVRNYYFGIFTLNKFCYDHPSLELFGDRLISEIQKLQFLEHFEKNLQVPTKMEMDVPEGVKTLIIIPPECKFLLIKADYIILRANGELVKVPYEEFLKHISAESIRMDEEQYIIQPINKIDYWEMIIFFKSYKI